MAYDAAHAQVVLFGGIGSGALFNDTWTWDGTDWTKRTPAHLPSARYRHAMAYGAAHDLGHYPNYGCSPRWSLASALDGLLSPVPETTTALLTPWPAIQRSRVYGAGWTGELRPPLHLARIFCDRDPSASVVRSGV
jgi:hypothetical protein